MDCISYCTRQKSKTSCNLHALSAVFSLLEWVLMVYNNIGTNWTASIILSNSNKQSSVDTSSILFKYFLESTLGGFLSATVRENMVYFLNNKNGFWHHFSSIFLFHYIKWILRFNFLDTIKILLLLLRLVEKSTEHNSTCGSQSCLFQSFSDSPSDSSPSLSAISNIFILNGHAVKCPL